MNKPMPPPVADDDIGPLDENGQQAWSQHDEAAARLRHADPAYWAAIEAAEESAARGEFHTHEQVVALSAERRRRWLAERDDRIRAERAERGR